MGFGRFLGRGVASVLIVGALVRCSTADKDQRELAVGRSPLFAYEQAKLAPSDVKNDMYFGGDVAVDGNTIVVGSHWVEAAYVYVRAGSTWSEQQKLVPSDGIAGDRFGERVAISGDTAVVSAQRDDGIASNTGSAFVFVRSGTTWSEQQKLTASDEAATSYFGRSLDVQGDTILVTSYNASGSAYHFQRSGTTWSEVAKLVPSGGPSGNYGEFVRIDGATAVVGAYSEGGTGAAHVFTRSGTTWSEQQKLVASDAKSNDYFGWSGDISGDTVLIGAIGVDAPLSAMGAGYVFVRAGSTWSQQTKIVAGDGQASDSLGYATGLSGNYAVLGSYDDDNGYEAGAAYVFARSGTTWAQLAKLYASDAIAYAEFSSSVALDHDTMVSGAPGADTTFEYSGAAYAYVLAGAGCSTSADCGTGFCSGAVCCNAACSSPCQTCRASEGSVQDGQCGLRSAGTTGAPSCAPYFCDGKSATCPTSCAKDSDCSSGHCADGVCCDQACSGPCVACVNVKTGAADGVCAPIPANTDPDGDCTDDGSPSCQNTGLCDGAGACQKYSSATGCTPRACGSDAECSSGHCADGICCDSACSGACRSCLASKKGAGVDGVCAPVAADTDPDDECALDPGYPGNCGADGQCNGVGACRTLAKPGVACGASTCVGDEVKGQVCNGLGQCAASPKGTSCAPYPCQGAACATSCSTDSDCLAGAYCTTTGACATKRPNGTSCGSVAECDSGLCVDGYCCNAACGGQCEACDVPGVEGACAAVTGAPHGGRAACPAGSADEPCASAQCDGSERTTCAGFVGSSVQCRAAACADGVASLSAYCDGKGACPVSDEIACAPFTCSADACKKTCSSDSDCTNDTHCDAASGLCVGSATCDGDHTVTDVKGQSVDCTPYKCTPEGACSLSCTSVADCVAPFVCDGKQCVLPSDESTTESGCGCRLAGRSTPTDWPWALGALALALLARRFRRRGVLAATCATLSLGCSTNAPEPVASARAEIGATQAQKLVTSDPTPSAGFGGRVVASGATFIATGGGGYYEFGSAGTWTQKAKLLGLPSGPIALSQDRLVIGDRWADGASPGAGAAHVYQRSGTSWVFEAKLQASAAGLYDGLGYAVSISGTTVLAGAPEHDGKAYNAGAAYVFQRTGTSWVEQAKLIGSAAKVEDFVGDAVAVDGDTAVIGGPHAGPYTMTAGAAFAFARSGSTWTEQAKLAPTDAALGDGVGAAVAVSGDTAVVGARFASSKGAAYVFVRTGTTWAEQAKLLPSDVLNGQGFGTVLALAGDVLVVGLPLADPVGADSGAAYVFVRSGTAWAQHAKIVPTDGGAGDRFGTSVALSADSLLVGASGDDDAATDAGAVYVFSLGSPTCTQASDCGAGGFCVDGYCCNEVCSGACRTCAKARGAVLNGVCTLAKTGDAGNPACGAYLCDGKNSSCPASCQGDSDCSTGHCADGVCCDKACQGACEACVQSKTGVSSGTCSPVAQGTDPDGECSDDGSPSCQKNGMCNGAGACQTYSAATGCVPSPCTVATDCTSGFCADGVCCDQACSGPCQACTKAKKGSGVDGVCEPVAADTDPDDECPKDPGYPSSCLSDGSCDGTGACRTLAKPGVTCGATACQGGSVVGQICDGVGFCLEETSGTSCSPYLCQGGACGSSCSSDDDCAADGYCTSAGTCAKRQANGLTCSRKEECASGLCVDGRCCNATCTAQCEACDVAGVEGTCAPVVGEPHAGRPACSQGSATSPCSAASCDGKDRSSCAGFVGSSVPCREASCADGTQVAAAYCDGNGTCPAVVESACAPFACGPTACRSTCGDDTDCAENALCDTTSGGCKTGATCDGDHTVTDLGGQKVDCSPFRCAVNGSCKASCASIADCVSGLICSADGKCVEPGRAAGTAEEGCGCRAGKTPPLGGIPFATLLVAWFVRRRRASPR